MDVKRTVVETQDLLIKAAAQIDNVDVSDLICDLVHMLDAVADGKAVRLRGSDSGVSYTTEGTCVNCLHFCEDECVLHNFCVPVDGGCCDWVDAYEAV